MRRGFFERTNDVHSAIKYTECFQKLNSLLAPAVDHGKNCHMLIRIGGGVAQACELTAQAVVEELVPLGPEHVVIGPFTPGFNEEIDHFRHQELVDAGNGQVDWCIVGENAIDQDTVGLIDRKGNFG